MFSDFTCQMMNLFCKQRIYCKNIYLQNSKLFKDLVLSECLDHSDDYISETRQRYTYRVLQTIQMKLILLWVWAERAVLGRAKTALKFKYEI